MVIHRLIGLLQAELIIAIRFDILDQIRPFSRSMLHPVNPNEHHDDSNPSKQRVGLDVDEL
jgi:hypothetical protein